MGLIIALLMTASYCAGLLFTVRFLRARVLVRSIFTYLVVLTLCAFLLLPVNMVAFVWCLGLLGADTEFAGAGFAYMGATIFSVIVMVLVLMREIWHVFRAGKSGRVGDGRVGIDKVRHD